MSRVNDLAPHLSAEPDAVSVLPGPLLRLAKCWLVPPVHGCAFTPRVIPFCRRELFLMRVEMMANVAFRFRVIALGVCTAPGRQQKMGLSIGRQRTETRLEGKTAIITGCNTGIGKCSAAELCTRGCRVIMACRDVEKAEEARKDMAKDFKDVSLAGELKVKLLDLASMKSIRAFAQEILEEEPRIDILINNAGVMMCPLQRTEDGFEMQLGTNHLGHFLLTMLLLPLIIRSAPARIINLSSSAHKVGHIDFDDLNWEKAPYSPIVAYGRSKLANILFTKELARRLKGTGVTVYAVHPGIVQTELGRHLDETYFPGFRLFYRSCIGWCLKNPEEGAQTTIYCAVEERTGRETGLYYSDCRATLPASKARDMEVAKKLWEISWKMVELGDFDPFVPIRSTVNAW